MTFSKNHAIMLLEMWLSVDEFSTSVAATGTSTGLYVLL